MEKLVTEAPDPLITQVGQYYVTEGSMPNVTKIITYNSADAAAVAALAVALVAKGIVDAAGAIFAKGIFDGTDVTAKGIFDGTDVTAKGIFDGTTATDVGVFDGTTRELTGLLDADEAYHAAGFLDNNGDFNTAVGSIGPWPVTATHVGPHAIRDASLGPYCVY